MEIDIREIGAGAEEAVFAASTLFDAPPDRHATHQVIHEPTHHLLIAYARAREPVGFVSGIQTTHPDKGTEMFLYELGVDEGARRKGVGRSLITALAKVAKDCGCYGMWTATDPENVAARRTYEAAGALAGPPAVVLEWRFGQ